jgi:hypothetical protein
MVQVDEPHDGAAATVPSGHDLRFLIFSPRQPRTQDGTMEVAAQP